MPSIVSPELHAVEPPETPYSSIVLILAVVVAIYVALGFYKLVELCRRRVATNADSSKRYCENDDSEEVALTRVRALKRRDASCFAATLISPTPPPNPAATVAPIVTSSGDSRNSTQEDGTMKASVRRKAPSASGAYRFQPPATPYVRPSPAPAPGSTSSPAVQRSVLTPKAPRPESQTAARPESQQGRRPVDFIESYDNVKLFGYPVPTYGGRPVNWRPVITADVDNTQVRRYFLPPDVFTLRKVANRIGGRLDAVMPFGFPKDFSIHSPPLTVFDVESDGNCLFRAISMYLLGNETYHRAFRKLACDTVESNKTAKWVDDLGGGNGNLPIEQRIAEMRKDARHLNDHSRWGGSLEMAALALALDMNIYCFEEDNIHKRVWQAYAPETTEKTSFLLLNLKKRFSVALLHGKHHFKAVVAIA
uniref:OTU domain-containing protein n=1 Tax=Steinernema glaseri TaxID=37863 RepID=A0A1I7YPV3_9BILA